MTQSSKSAPSYLADFDSASAMVRAASNYLRGDDFPAIGQSPAIRPLAEAVSWLPKSAREQFYAVGGAFEGISPRSLSKVNAEEIAEWASLRYPQRTYQAVAIGSSNGALVHLAAALDMPWLPQTVFIPVRHFSGDSDDPKDALRFAQEHGPALLEANPELALHNMHDGNQDRLMVAYMDYFRVKRLTLGQTYERFLDRNLDEDGTIVVVECERKWPTTRLGERQVFQHGAVGGATEKEFHEGSERVEEYLERYDAPVRRWDSPDPDGESPEAEWGFEPALRDDIRRYARARGRRILRLVFEEPEHLSPLVADFYRDWYARRNMRANRLLIESFAMLEPYWTLRTGSVPYWMTFNMDPSLDDVEAYLKDRAPFDDINLMLFNHGVEAVGFPQMDEWKKRILPLARRRGQLLGLKEDLYPRDFGALARYRAAIRKLPARYPLPGGLPLARFIAFARANEGRYQVKIIEEDA